MTPDSPLARVGAELDAIRTGHGAGPSRVDDDGLGESGDLVTW